MSDLRLKLDALFDCCKLWKLKVNNNKSKVVVFSKGRLQNDLNFKYNDIPLDLVNEFFT